MHRLLTSRALQHVREPVKKPRVHFETTARGYRLWWLGLILLHIINIAYYVLISVMYVAVENTYLSIQLETYSIGVPSSEYRKVSAIHAILAAIHAVFVGFMIGSSVYNRRLTFSFDFNPLQRHVSSRASPYFRKLSAWTKRIAASELPQPTAVKVGSISRASSARVPQSVIAVARTGSTIFSRSGILGVDSVYFDHVLLIRECLETALQTYQLYRMTQLLPRLWLIRFYVALLIANCWIVPILHRYYRDREVVRRMLSLLCDAVLDILSSIGITLMLLAVYAPQYTRGYGFALPNWTNDKWMANLQQEFQMMLVASWMDMFSRLVFAFGLLQCMDAMKDLLTQPVASDIPKNISCSATGAAPSLLHASVPFKCAALRPLLSRMVSILVHNVVPGVFVMWGFALLAIQIVAETRSSIVPCELRLRPWLSLQPACSLIELNCFDLQSNGSDQALVDAWNEYDSSRVTRLVFLHCPSLVMTSKIHDFSHLSSLKVYNSTVASWPNDAALRAQSHDRMRAVFLVRTFVPNGELPLGLLSPAFPRRLTTFSTSVTNIRRLPENLHTIWPRCMTLVFEFSRMTTVPDVVVRMSPTTIAVSGSPITGIQASVFEIKSLVALGLAMTKIQELPSSVLVPSTVLQVLNIQRTNVTAIWSWLDPFILRASKFSVKLFNANGTDYCNERRGIVQGARAQFSAVERSASVQNMASVMDISTPKKLAYAQHGVNCELSLLTNFPLPLEDAVYSLH